MSQALSTVVRSSIEEWAMRLLQQSRLAHVVRRGALGPRSLGLYLESLRHLFVCSQRNLGAAAERSQALGLSQLAEYFAGKAREERGHEQWAVQDLLRLPDAATRGLHPAAASLALGHLQRELVAEHPLCMLAYAVWAEYLTALLGDEWLKLLANNGYDRDAVSAVSKHVEADTQHAPEGFAALDHFWEGTPSAQRILESVARAQRLFELLCEEVCEATEPANPEDVRAPLPS